MNVVKDLLKSGATAIGTDGSITSDVRFLANSGFDFLLFELLKPDTNRSQ